MVVNASDFVEYIEHVDAIDGVETTDHCTTWWLKIAHNENTEGRFVAAESCRPRMLIFA
jgi:hypothetical protein